MVTTYYAIGLAVVVFGLGIALGWTIRSMYERAVVDQYRKRCANYRQKIAEISHDRMGDVQDEASRHAACEIEISELKKQLKAANIIKDGWRSAADKSRCKF